MNDAHKGWIRDWIEEGMHLEVVGSGEIRRDAYTGHAVLYEISLRAENDAPIETHFGLVIEFREAISIYVQAGSAAGKTKHSDLTEWELPEHLRLSLPPWFV